MKSVKKNKGMKPSAFFSFGVLPYNARGGGRKAGQRCLELHRVSADIRLYSSVMGKPSWVPMSKCSCYVLYLPHVYTGRGVGGTYMECARVA